MTEQFEVWHPDREFCPSFRKTPYLNFRCPGHKVTMQEMVKWVVKELK